MSTALYGRLSARRTASPALLDTGDGGVSTYIDALAALVPAEAIAAHAVIVQLASKTAKDTTGSNVFTITDRGALQFSFWALIALTIVLFFIGRQGFAGLSWQVGVQAIIPPCAFVAWTMIQTNTAFDAVFDLAGDRRSIIAIFAAILLGAVAKALAKPA